MTAFRARSATRRARPSSPRSRSWSGSPSSSPGWQLRGDLDLGDEELGAILGEELRRKLRVTSTSLWSGSGGSRTPLHRDDVSALVWQCVGRKRFFLVAEKDVEEAVAKGKLPSAVLEGGSEAHCVEGSLEDVFGLHEAEPTSAGRARRSQRRRLPHLPAGLTTRRVERRSLDEFDCAIRDH